jgi:hypothetical protein
MTIYMYVYKTVARVYHITVKGTLIQLEIKMKKHEGYMPPGANVMAMAPVLKMGVLPMCGSQVSSTIPQTRNVF